MDGNKKEKHNEINYFFVDFCFNNPPFKSRRRKQKPRSRKIIKLRPRIRKGNRNHENTNRPIIDMKLYGLETAVRVNAGKRALGSAWWIGSQFRPTTLAGQTRYILKMSSVNLPRTMQYIQGMPSWRTNDPARSKLQGGHQGGGNATARVTNLMPPILDPPTDLKTIIKTITD